MNYSIIIPHKNCPQLLTRCLDSIPKREDLEIIVVDDNSDSDIVDFAHFPGYDRDGVQLIFTKEGKGAGYSRNVGLEHATGKWLLFFDADDFALPKFNEILDAIVDSNADIMFFRPKSVMSDNIEIESKRRGRLYNEIIDKYISSGEDLELRTRWYVPWSKIISHSLVKEKNIRFDEIKYSNDEFFSIKIGCEARLVKAIDDFYYVVTEGENTLTSSLLKKPGELESRAFATLHAAQAIAESPYKVDDGRLCSFAYQLYHKNDEMYNRYVDFIQKTYGYSRLFTYWRIFIIPVIYRKFCKIKGLLNEFCKN